jgi:hypothetical protein
MDRAKRTKKTEVSRLKPLNIDDLSQSDDCFGKAWDPQHRLCSICADVDICGVVYQEKVVIPKKKKFDESLPLDLLDFSKVDWAKIGKLVKKYQDDGEPMTYEELMRYIKDLANIKDEFMIKLFIEKSLKLNKLKCTEHSEIVIDA